MLKNEDIICISWVPWETMTPIVMHQMMTRLSKHNRVLFVDPPVAYSSLWVQLGMWRDYWQNTSLWLQGVRKIRGNLYVYSPPPLVLHYGHITTVDRRSQAIMTSALKKVAKKLGFETPILWIYHPYAIVPEGALNEKAVCYDCNDDVGFFFCQWFDKRKRLTAMEKDLTEKADVVFATSRHLYELRKQHNPNTHYLPSGADIALFQKALSPALKVPPELERLPGPVIGFVGSIINTLMNWEWIHETIVSRPQWHFVFIGPCRNGCPPPDITEQRNVAFLGHRPAETLPAYLKRFDVCLIPYKGEEFLKACSPTKTFEYLAAGKPVVASWIPELEEYQHVIRLSHDAQEFIQQIEAALVDGQKPWMVEEYVRVAHGRTWEDRVEKASQLIASQFAAL